MEVNEVFPGVLEMHMTYGKDTPGLMSEGSFPHAVWYVAGEHPALLDPGPTVVAEATLRTLRDLGHDPNDIEYIVPSHLHVDHGGACGWLVRELPNAKEVLHSRAVPYMRDIEKLAEGTRQVFGDDWEENFGVLLPVPEEKMVIVEDGSKLEMGGKPYEIVFMPGHSLDHIGVWDVENEALYSGHGLGNYMPLRFMPDPPMTLPYFDVDAAVSSIRKARDLKPRYLLPAHTGFLASNPAYAIDAVERVTVEIGDMIKRAMADGVTTEAMDEQVRTYLFGNPDLADRSFMHVVLSYVRFYERQARHKNS